MGYLLDSFQSAIHTNEQLTDTQKVQYLKMYVDKTAAETISGLQLTSSNYKQAIKLLTDCFASKQLIVSSYMNTLFKLSAVEVMVLLNLDTCLIRLSQL